MVANFRNGARTAPADPLVELVPEPLRKDFEEVFETEGMMDQSAENRLLAAIGKNHNEIMSRMDRLRDRIHEVDKRTVSAEEHRKAIYAIEVRIKAQQDEADGRFASIEKGLSALLPVQRDYEDRLNNRKQDARKVRDKLLDVAVVLLLAGLLTMGIQYIRSNDAPSESKQDQIISGIKDLTEAIKSAQQERQVSQPDQTAAPKSTKPARKPQPQLLNKLDDVVAKPVLRAYSRIEIESMEGRPQ